MTDPAKPVHRPSRRISDLSVIAPLIGFFLLIPPFIGLFASEQKVFGAPLILLYLFGVWLGLIVAAAALSRALRQHDAGREKP